MYKDGPYVDPGHEGHGWLWALTPRQVYELGLDAVDRAAQTRYRALYHRLKADDRARLTFDLASGEMEEFEEISSQTFFMFVRQNVIEGLFSDPIYGGNRDHDGWRWLGFPGDPDAYGDPYTDRIDRPGDVYAVEPRGLLGSSLRRQVPEDSGLGTFTDDRITQHTQAGDLDFDDVPGPE
jgi:gluconate 2-dehydrogenase gamma chain